MSKKKDSKKIIWSSDISRWDREEAKEVYNEIYDEYPENDDKLNEFIENENSLHLEDEQANIFYHEKKHGQKLYVIEADVGLWYGRRTGYALMQGMWHAIAKCLEDYNTIYSFNGGIHIEANHHDGTNLCRIKELTQVGQDYYYRNHNVISDAELFHKLFDNSRYSRNPRLFKEMYGW